MPMPNTPIVLNLEAALNVVRANHIPHAGGIELAIGQAIDALQATPSFSEGELSNLTSAVAFYQQAYADQASDQSQANIKEHCLRKATELGALLEKLKTLAPV